MTAKGTIASLNEEEQDTDQFNREDVLDRTERATRRRGDGAGRGMKRQTFEVDLSKLQGEGDFPCPKCGVVISPDDESEETYTVLETKGDEDSIEEVVIQCKKCGSTIELKGFEQLEEAESGRKVELSEAQPGSRLGFRTIHVVSVDGKVVGRVAIEYLQEEDVKAFTKINRDLKAGDAFQARVFVDSSTGVTADQLGKDGLADIVKSLKRRAKGIRERDIFLVAVEGGRERLIGRAETVTQGSE